MKFVLTNDDGIDGVGLLALSDAVDGKGTIVAPREPHSGCSHQVTFRSPIHVEARADGAYCVTGTPADCTRVALAQLCPDATMLLAGINPGGNLGMDVYLSGTVAAVREAAFMGIPAIAFSHYIKMDLIKKGATLEWKRATRWTSRVIETIIGRDLEPGVFWNVNFPHLESDAPEPELIDCGVCKQALPVSYRIEGEHYHYDGRYGERARDPGADVDVCFSGNIAISKIRI